MLLLYILNVTHTHKSHIHTHKHMGIAYFYKYNKKIYIYNIHLVYGCFLLWRIYARCLQKYQNYD